MKSNNLLNIDMSQPLDTIRSTNRDEIITLGEWIHDGKPPTKLMVICSHFHSKWVISKAIHHVLDSQTLPADNIGIEP